MAQRCKKRLKNSSRQSYNIGILFLPVQRRVEKNSTGFFRLDSRTIKRGRCSFARKFAKWFMIESLHCIP
jgi:hypothetical protein